MVISLNPLSPLICKVNRASPNHEIHFLARELKGKDDWLTVGIQALINGNYTPRYLKRIYFPDEMIDQLHLSDRILQHILLKQLKPTFPHVMNPNCYHLHGPGGVKLVTERIRQIIQEKKPAFLIRADIKSFYKSIPHYQLIQYVKKHYHDEKVCLMLEILLKMPLKRLVDIKIRIQVLHCVDLYRSFLTHFI